MTSNAWTHPVVICCILLSGRNSNADRSNQPKVPPEEGEHRKDEKTIRMEPQSPDAVKWFLELRAAKRASLPYTKISRTRVDCLFEGMKYFVGSERGRFDEPGGSSKLRILSQGNSLVLNLAERE
jgi:hypothetical protein